MIGAQRKYLATAPWDGQRLYHCSPFVYDKPCMIQAEKHIRKADKHPNGMLGLWLSNVPELCIGFGPFVYETTLAPSAKIGIVSYRELLGWHKAQRMAEADTAAQIAFYKRLRQELLSELDVMYIDDEREMQSDLLGEIIVVNLSAITRHEIVEEAIWRNRKLNLGMA